MPTFQSIGVHPALRSRLVTQSSVIAAASTKEATGNEDPAQARSDEAQHSAAARRHYSAVETPLSLLACHPDSLRLLDPATGKCNALAGDQVTSLRQEVAHAIVSETFDGRHVDRVRRALRSRAAKEGEGASSIEGIGSVGLPSKRKRRLSPSNVENENPPSNAIDSGDEVINVCANDEATTKITPASTSNEQQMVGSLTSLDLIRYESLLRRYTCDGPEPPLTTGSKGLDELLSFPVEYGGILGPSTGGIGVPRGYVTQLYGPSASGKTQVALHVVAHRLGEERSGLASHNPTPLFAQEKRRRTHYPCWVLVPPGRQVLCAERIAELCGNDSAVMGQTYVLPVSDIYQGLSVLASVEEELPSSAVETSDALGPSADAAHHGAASGTTPPSLIVFDGASTCCCFSDPTSEEAIRLLHQLAKTLKRIARHHLAAVLVTNGSVMVTPQPTSGPGSGAADLVTKRMVPALGRIWERAVDIQVQLECALPSPNGTPSIDVRKASLMRHPTKAATCSTGSTRAAYFSIHKSFGVRDARGSGSK